MTTRSRGHIENMGSVSPGPQKPRKWLESLGEGAGSEPPAALSLLLQQWQQPVKAVLSGDSWNYCLSVLLEQAPNAQFDKNALNGMQRAGPMLFSNMPCSALLTFLVFNSH